MSVHREAMVIVTPERIAAAPLRHIVRLRAIRRQAIAALPIQRRTTAAIRQPRRHPTAALRRRAPIVREAMADLAEAAATRVAAPQVAAAGEAAAVHEAAVRRVGVPEVPRAVVSESRAKQSGAALHPGGPRFFLGAKSIAVRFD